MINNHKIARTLRIIKKRNPQMNVVWSKKQGQLRFYTSASSRKNDAVVNYNDNHIDYNIKAPDAEIKHKMYYLIGLMQSLTNRRYHNPFHA